MYENKNLFHFREAEHEIKKLSQLAEQLNPKLNEMESSQICSNSTDQVDLDQLFNFLSKEVADSSVPSSGSIRSSSVNGSVHSGETPEKSGSSILDEIDKQMSDLQNEIDRFSLTEEGGGSGNTDRNSTPTTSDTPPPPPLPTG